MQYGEMQLFPKNKYLPWPEIRIDRQKSYPLIYILPHKTDVWSGIQPSSKMLDKHAKGENVV